MTEFDRQSPLNILGLERSVAGSVYYPFSVAGHPLGIRLNSDHRVSGSGWANRYQADVNSRIGAVNARISYRDVFSSSGQAGQSTGRLRGTFTYTVSRTPGIPTYLRGSFIRSQIAVNPSKGTVSEADLSFSRTFARIVRLQFGVGRNFDFNYTSGFLSMTIDFNRTRTATTIRKLPGSYNINQNIRGNISFDETNARVVLNNREQVGRAALSVRMFVDNNGSSTYDEGDRLLTYNAVRVSGASGRQVGPDGVTRLHQLQQYFRYNLEINRNAIREPMLVPIVENFSFIADPNRYKHIDIPFYTSGVIEGRVIRVVDGKESPLSGVRLQLINDRGEVVETIRTFSDGSFYAMEILPGSYRLKMDPAQLTFLKSFSDPEFLEFEIQALAEGDFLDGLTIRVLPLPESGAAGE